MLLKVYYFKHSELQMNIKEQVGNRIRQLRLENGISQEYLALEIELDRTYLSHVENGKRNIAIVNLQKIWKFFNLQYSFLYI